MTDETREGWGPVFNIHSGRYSDKWHYFRDNRSLCRKYLRLSDEGLEGDMVSPDNCASCERARQRETNPSARRRRGSYTGGS